MQHWFPAWSGWCTADGAGDAWEDGEKRPRCQGGQHDWMSEMTRLYPAIVRPADIFVNQVQPLNDG